MINVSENATYLVSNSSGFKAILRVHRENYHTERAIECELEWIANLSNKKSVKVPGHFIGKNNKPIQEAQIEGLKNKRILKVLNEQIHFINLSPIAIYSHHGKSRKPSLNRSYLRQILGIYTHQQYTYHLV